MPTGGRNTHIQKRPLFYVSASRVCHLPQGTVPVSPYYGIRSSGCLQAVQATPMARVCAVRFMTGFGREHTCQTLCPWREVESEIHDFI